MMIASPSAGDPSAAAAALDRALRSGAAQPDDADSSPDDATPGNAPDVVVTLSHGDPAPSTYDASGRMGRRPTLDDLGANGPNSMAHASESDASEGGGDDGGADARQEAAVAA